MENVVDLGQDTCDASLKETFDKLPEIVDLSKCMDEAEISASTVVTDSQDDVPLAQISQRTVCEAGKGKRKHTNKRVYGSATKSIEMSDVLATPVEHKLLKTIKKEKI